MTAQTGVRFGIANGLLIAAFFAAAVARLDATETAWTVVLTAGLLGLGLSLLMTACLGAIAWAWFTGFVEHRFGLLTFAGHDLQRFAVFVVAAMALAAFVRGIDHMIKENAHG
jgi:hypothetical protein